MSNSYRRRKKSKGTILVLSALLMVALLGMLALAIDVGQLCVARQQLQRTADAAALAAAWELLDEEALTGYSNDPVLEENAREVASQYAALNPVLQVAPALDTEDVVVGHLTNPSDPNSQLDLSGANPPNAVWVRVRRTAVQNGEVPFFFGSVLGRSTVATQTEATATLVGNFGGFQTSSGGGNLDLLPFALDLTTWTDLLNGSGTDDWKWDSELQEVCPGADGILEVNLYPQGTGSPGNRGTVDIGSNNNSTNDIARQITDGISPADLAYHGGSLEFDSNGELFLNGDTGISAGVKDELESIIGQPRIIPIFEQVSGPGNNAQYTIVQFAGIRIVDVKLTGKQSSKRVIIQPASVVVRGGIPSTTTGTTHFVYSPVWLVR